jgi:hypothetical protein
MRRGVLGLIAAMILAAGCTPPENTGQRTDNKPKPAPEKKDDRSEWWCAEHGIPEHECCLCLPADEVKTLFKDKGDWCALHDRAKSQCFKCDPKLKERFAAKYRARYGEEPPPITEEEDEKKKDDKN